MQSWLAVFAAVVVRPSLWPTAFGQAVRLAPPGWWHRWPFLPRPTSAYVAFRQLTAQGSTTGIPAAEDVIVWLAWCRTWRRTA